VDFAAHPGTGVSDADHRIRALSGEAEVATCARMMAESEPWMTLGRTVEASIRVLQDPGKEVYVADDGGRIEGFLVLDMRGPFPGYIQTVCVRAGARGQGLGARLIAWAEARILRDVPNVFMCVSTFNRQARRLYERLGYTVVGELSSYLIPDHGEILLRKTTGPWSEFRRDRPS
jgi:ribosomal protein S18 acetylase RimI-like enzyme